MPDANYFIDHCRKLTQYEQNTKDTEEMYKSKAEHWNRKSKCASQLWYPVMSNSIKSQEEPYIANRLPSTQSTMGSLSQHPFEANSGLDLFTLRGTPHTPALWVVIRIHKHAEFLNLAKLTAKGADETANSPWRSQWVCCSQLRLWFQNVLTWKRVLNIPRQTGGDFKAGRPKKKDVFEKSRILAHLRGYSSYPQQIKVIGWS